MSSDMAVAAACSNGSTHLHLQSLQQRKRQREQPQHSTPAGLPDQVAELELEDVYEGAEWGELPSIDDLEVAAAAAEAAIEATKLAVPQALTESSSEDEESSEEEDEDMQDEAASTSDEETEKSNRPPVSVSLLFPDGGREEVCMKLTVNKDAAGPCDDPDSEAGSEVLDPGLLEEMLARMEDDGDDARAAAREAAEMAAGLPPVEPLDVDITADDTLLPAGTISAVIDSQIVVQAPKDSRAMDAGSVLCLPDRTPLGRVEEIFGPVAEPLYTLRFAGGTEVPAGVRQGAAVCSVERFNTYVLAEAVQQAVREEHLDEEGMEVEFSDDDAEAVFQRQAAGPASTAQPQPQPAPFRGGRNAGPSNRGHGRAADGDMSHAWRSNHGSGRASQARGRGPWQQHPHSPRQQRGMPSRGSHMQGQSPGLPQPQGMNQGWRNPGARGGRGRRGRLASSLARDSAGRSMSPQYGAPAFRDQMDGGSQVSQFSGVPPPAVPAQGGQWVWIPPGQAQPVYNAPVGGAVPSQQQAFGQQPGAWPPQPPQQPHCAPPPASHGPAGMQGQQMLYSQQPRTQPQGHGQQLQPPLSFYPQGLP